VHKTKTALMLKRKNFLLKVRQHSWSLTHPKPFNPSLGRGMWCLT